MTTPTNKRRGERVYVPLDAALTRVVARAVRARRIALGMTQRELGMRIGSSKTNVNSFELRPRPDMTLGLLERLAHALSISVVELIRQADAYRFLVHDCHEEQEAAE